MTQGLAIFCYAFGLTFMTSHMTSFHSTDWALRVMHIWSNLHVHREAGMPPRNWFITAKIAQLLTPMMKEGLTQSYGIFQSQRPSEKKHICHKTVCNPLTLDLQVFLCFIRL